MPCGSSSADGRRAADAALATRATAVMAFSDYVALGVLARFDELGVSVPGDVSLTGFDDIALSELLRPRLTTVKVSKQDLGRRAWELFAAGGDVGGGESGRVVTAIPELITRDSTAPCGDRHHPASEDREGLTDRHASAARRPRPRADAPPRQDGAG